MLAMKYSRSNMGRSQRGAVLIVSLVILLVLTILGVSAMRGSALEGKIASNYRLEQLITQAAEAALLEGERLIESLDVKSLVSDTCTNGYCTSRKTDPGYAASIGKTCADAAHLEERWALPNGCSGNLDVWNTAGRSIAYSSSNLELTAKVKASYIIEYLGFVGAAASCSVSPPPVPACPDMYRITALASDLSDKGRILIQTTYQK